MICSIKPVYKKNSEIGNIFWTINTFFIRQTALIYSYVYFMCNLTFDVFVDFINIFFVLFWGITITYLGLWSFGQLHIECCYLKQITYTYVHHNMQLWYKSIPLVLWNYIKKKNYSMRSIILSYLQGWNTC